MKVLTEAATSWQISDTNGDLTSQRVKRDLVENAAHDLSKISSSSSKELLFQSCTHTKYAYIIEQVEGRKYRRHVQRNKGGY